MNSSTWEAAVIPGDMQSFFFFTHDKYVLGPEPKPKPTHGVEPNTPLKSDVKQTIKQTNKTLKWKYPSVVEIFLTLIFFFIESLNCLRVKYKSYFDARLTWTATVTFCGCDKKKTTQLQTEPRVVFSRSPFENLCRDEEKWRVSVRDSSRAGTHGDNASKEWIWSTKQVTRRSEKWILYQWSDSPGRRVHVSDAA